MSSTYRTDTGSLGRGRRGCKTCPRLRRRGAARRQRGGGRQSRGLEKERERGVRVRPEIWGSRRGARKSELTLSKSPKQSLSARPVVLGNLIDRAWMVLHDPSSFEFAGSAPKASAPLKKMGRSRARPHWSRKGDAIRKTRRTSKSSRQEKLGLPPSTLSGKKGHPKASDGFRGCERKVSLGSDECHASGLIRRGRACLVSASMIALRARGWAQVCSRGKRRALPSFFRSGRLLTLKRHAIFYTPTVEILPCSRNPLLEWERSSFFSRIFSEDAKSMPKCSHSKLDHQNWRRSKEDLVALSLQSGLISGHRW